MKRKMFVFLCLLALLLVALPTAAQDNPPPRLIGPPSIVPVTPEPTPEPPRFQFGAISNTDGAAAGFWVDGYNVNMLYVYPDGQFYYEMQPVNCDIESAEVAAAGHIATAFVLCADGYMAHLRYSLPDGF